MAELAIKGHETRGAEVIEILKMLGGTNTHNYSADSDIFCFYIGKGINDINVIYYDWIHGCYDDEELIVFTLEGFLEKFPYKVGDKVQYKGTTSCSIVYEIEQMKWEDNQVKYIICGLYWKNIKCTATTENLQPYKPYGEETMEEEGVYFDNEINCYHQDFGDKVRIRLGGDFEIKVEDNKTYIVKKKPHYPKTYKECCEVLMGKTDFQDFELVLTKLSINQAQSGINIFPPAPPHITLINNFYKLLICRDAYWKIAGEEMGLGKPWKPDENKNNGVYYIFYCVSNGEIRRTAGNLYSNEVFSFPTKEIRNAFFDNFKELIEQCKELL